MLIGTGQKLAYSMHSTYWFWPKPDTWLLQEVVQKQIKYSVLFEREGTHSLSTPQKAEKQGKCGSLDVSTLCILQMNS